MDKFIVKSPGYCKEAVLSVAADFNSGALLCECDNEGTEAGQTSVCAKMGGQCSCKPNVIGRQCTKCKPDFFGFPDCKQVCELVLWDGKSYHANDEGINNSAIYLYIMLSYLPPAVHMSSYGHVQ